MRLLHTADWHLGQNFHGVSRDFEHACFLAWLLDQIESHAVDALVVAGDIFDGQNPPIPAQAAFYRFIAQAKARRPALDVVVVAGNHDSGGRLEAPSPLLDEMGVRVVGGLTRDRDGRIDVGRLLVPLRNRAGEVAALCAAVPYLRVADLPAVATPADNGSADPFVEGMRQVYAEVLAGARDRLGARQALVATGHCYMTGGRLSLLSERKILGGNLHALPVDIFPDEAAYVALGHLHRAQAVGERAGVRYSGSPLPLSLDEDGYPHQVVLAEFEDGALVGTTALAVPRFVEILRLPGPEHSGPAGATLAEILPILRALPLPADRPREQWPFLEVTVRLDAPQPGMRAEVEAALDGRPVRLLKLGVTYSGDGATLADGAPGVELAALAPEDVFRKCYQRSHDGDPDPRLVAAFHELVATAQEAGA